MGQLGIGRIQIFHRQNYPSHSGAITGETLLDNITVILSPKLSELSNKADDFLSLKPRNFDFSVRAQDTSFLNSVSLEPHPNYKDLSNYCLRVLDYDDVIIFEGIIENSLSFDDNTQVFSVKSCDFLGIIYNNKLKLSTTDLENYYKNPKDLLNVVLSGMLADYFLSGTIPPFNTDWTLDDNGMAHFDTFIDYRSNIISSFYTDSRSTYRAIADARLREIAIELGLQPVGITDVFDYSKFNIWRWGNNFSPIPDWHAISVYCSFIGCVVYYDKVNKIWAALYQNRTFWWWGNDGITENPFSYPDSTDNYFPTMYYGVTRQDIGGVTRGGFSHAAWDYAGDDGVPVAISIFKDWIPPSPADYNDPTAESVDILPYSLKGLFLIRRSPCWNSSPNFMEDLYYWHFAGGNTWRYFLDIADLSVRKNTLLMQQGLEIDPSTYIEREHVLPHEREAIYKESDGYTYYGDYTSTFGTHIPSYDDLGFYKTYGGFIRMWQAETPPENWKSYHMKVYSQQAYNLDYNSYGVSPESFHQIGNISQFWKCIPTGIVIRQIEKFQDLGLDYIFNQPEVGQAPIYVEYKDLLLLVMTTCSLYISASYGLNITKTENVSGSHIVIDDSDVIDWKSDGSTPSSSEPSKNLNEVSNYNPLSVDFFYSDLVRWDSRRASCDISRLFNNYNIVLNSKLLIFSNFWRVESIIPTLADFQVKLTRYI